MTVNTTNTPVFLSEDDDIDPSENPKVLDAYQEWLCNNSGLLIANRDLLVGYVEAGKYWDKFLDWYRDTQS